MSPMWPDSQASRPSASAEGVLQVAADGQRRRRPSNGQGERQRGVAARPADRRARARRRPGPPSRRTAHGSAGRGSARRRRGRPAGQRLVVVGDDRLAGQVAAGHHQDVGARRVAGQAEQQVVHGRVGSITPRSALPGATRGRADVVAESPGAAARSGRPRPVEQAAPRPSESSTSRSRRVEVGDHHRERLVAALLALAQRRDRVVVGGVAGQVVAAEALDRDDRARRASSRRASAQRRPRRDVGRPARADAGAAAARSRGRRRSGRGSGGRPGRRTRRRRRRTAGSRPWWWPAGRRAGR